jgi:hypothetical protein
MHGRKNKCKQNFMIKIWKGNCEWERGIDLKMTDILFNEEIGC